MAWIMDGWIGPVLGLNSVNAERNHESRMSNKRRSLAHKNDFDSLNVKSLDHLLKYLMLVMPHQPSLSPLLHAALIEEHNENSKKPFFGRTIVRK
jgi:hypothetical protein